MGFFQKVCRAFPAEKPWFAVDFAQPKLLVTFWPVGVAIGGFWDDVVCWEHDRHESSSATMDGGPGGRKRLGQE